MSMGNPIMSLLTNNTLTGENFPKWKSNINIVLVSENNRFVLTEECPPVPPANVTRAVRELYDRWIASNNKAKAYMLASMSDALRSKMEPKECAFEIMESLQEMFGQQSEQARHEATRKYTNARMILGTHVRDHVMQMTNYFSEAEMHGAVIDEGTQVSIILNSLSSDFIPFTSNYIMNKLNYGMTQLLNELQTFEAILGLVKNKAEANIVNKPNSSKGLLRWADGREGRRWTNSQEATTAVDYSKSEEEEEDVLDQLLQKEKSLADVLDQSNEDMVRRNGRGTAGTGVPARERLTPFQSSDK
ncbi:hypothetical protein ZIOFF_074616 [Zingiber officinale]|uniref:Gag-pol polyprotein n=1 Tax=Zingiber officinale TaxID=94328 RepID=A0A8J5BV01_ZINOF|nr:hypothetical protein ZIOFF_074616 [Zingiber officinale]